MPYTVICKPFDAVGAFGGRTLAIVGSVFVPPNPPIVSGVVTSKPLDTATVTTPEAPFTLTFPSAAVPPAAPSSMLVSEATMSGDLFRSGPIYALPPSPAPLTLMVAPPLTLGQSTISDTLARSLPTTVPFPDEAKGIVGVLSGGTIIPQSVTVTEIALALGPSSQVVVTGALTMKWFGITDQDSGFTLTLSLGIAPSGDPSDISCCIRVFPTSPAISIDIAFISPSAGLALALFGGQLIASRVQSMLNAFIAEEVSKALASRGKQLTSTAVISIGRLTITPAGMSVVGVLGDIFGPGVEDIPIPKTMVVTTTSEVPGRSISLMVADAASRAPIAGASVTIHQTVRPGRATPPPGVHGTTAADGSVTLSYQPCYEREPRSSIWQPVGCQGVVSQGGYPDAQFETGAASSV